MHYDPSMQRRKHDQSSHSKPRHTDTTLEERVIQIERKTFSIAFKENHLGKFVRIREEGRIGRSAIVIPESGWQEFAETLSAMAGWLGPELPAVNHHFPEAELASPVSPERGNGG